MGHVIGEGSIMQNAPLPPRGRTFAPRRHRRLRVFLLVLSCLLIVGGVWGWRAWHAAQQTFSRTYQAAGRPSDTAITSGKPFAILLLGTDTGALGRHQVGRTDTMIVATILIMLVTENVRMIVVY